MPDVVADRLQGPARVDEALYAGMAQRVRTGPGNDDARFPQVVR